MDFRTQSARSLADGVRKGEMSAGELVEHCLERIEQLNPVLNAFVAVDGDRARADAAAIDRAVAAGSEVGPLAGLPLGVKDLEDAAGFVTSRGSKAIGAKGPAERHSALVERLTAAGCVIIGKTNTPEVGWKADTHNPLFGRTANPWNVERSPGGSSGGSAAAIASGMVPLATGSDGGGSIRIPSSCCGLSGMKPSLGRVPLGGPEAPAWQDLSTPGPMARRLGDIVTALEVVVGPDPTDLRSLPRPEASWLAALDEPRPPNRIAWAPTLGYAEVDSEVLAVCERAVEVMASLGADIIEIETVFDADPLDEWLTLSGVYNLRTYGDLLGSDAWQHVDPGLAMVVEAAQSVSAVDVVKAMDSCHSLNLRLVDLFRDVRLLLTPTTVGAAPPAELNGSGLVNGKVEVNWVKLTYPFNLTRSPAATVCAGLTGEGIPVGLQLVGPQHGDLVVLRAAAALEAALGFDAVPPAPASD